MRDTISATRDIGSGPDIAMSDLNLRGAFKIRPQWTSSRICME